MSQRVYQDKVFYVMGVSGAGKTLIGKLLAEELGLPFVDADDHHPAANIDKMRQGIPLNDLDRIPWLNELNRLARDHYPQGCVMACSALKEDYRRRLIKSIASRAVWIYLKGSYETIFERMHHREGHFMGAHMLQSQFDTLEEPDEAIIVAIDDQPEEIIANIKAELGAFD